MWHKMATMGGHMTHKREHGCQFIVAADSDPVSILIIVWNRRADELII